jgi:hypothetical protein
MTEQELEEVCREDFTEGLRQDVHHEVLLRRDIDYAFESLGLEDINIAIYKLKTQMYELGYDLSYKDVLDKLEEL